MKKLQLLVLLGMVMSLTACGTTIVNDENIDTENSDSNIVLLDGNDTETQVIEEGNLLTFTNEENGFSVKYPNDRRAEEDSFGAIVRFLPPQKEGDPYREEIVVDVYALEEGTTLNSYTEEAVTLLQEGLSDFTELNRKDIKIGKEKATKITFTGTRSKRNNEYQQVYLVKDNKVYIFTYTALEESFADFAEQFSDLVYSFEFVE